MRPAPTGLAVVGTALAAVLLTLTTSCAGGGPAAPPTASGSSPGGPGGPGSTPTSGSPTAPTPADVRPPPSPAVVDYQLGGPYEPNADVRVVTRDRTVAPVPGVYSICYVNAFQTQPDENDLWLTRHPDLLLRGADGGLVEDAGWPGEHLLDTSTPEKRAALADVVGAWIDGCADAGYQAVEADNLDAATRSGGLLDLAGAYDYAAALAARAHARGLAFAQKNTAGTTAEQARAVGFDFAVAESCQVYDECDDYTAVHGADVIEIEYSEDGYENFDRACAARGQEISVLYRDRDVLPLGVPGYESDHC